jgi:putative SOS response-associated peptidase YedK
MCNDYEEYIAWKAYGEAMQAEAWRIPTRQSELDLPAIAHVRITDPAPIIRATGEPDEVELVTMRWSWPAPNGKPVFNFRSEGRRFGDSLRCLIPTSAFYEFTGSKTPKTRHRFTLKGAPFCMAGLWKPGTGNEFPRFTMLTTAPGPDIAPYHDRQMAVLKPGDWRAWLDLTKPEGELLAPLPAGSLEVETSTPRDGVNSPAWAIMPFANSRLQEAAGDPATDEIDHHAEACGTRKTERGDEVRIGTYRLPDGSVRVEPPSPQREACAAKREQQPRRKRCERDAVKTCPPIHCDFGVSGRFVAVASRFTRSSNRSGSSSHSSSLAAS